MNDLLNWLKDQYREIDVLDDGSVVAVNDTLVTRAVYDGIRCIGYTRRKQ